MRFTVISSVRYAAYFFLLLFVSGSLFVSAALKDSEAPALLQVPEDFYKNFDVAWDAFSQGDFAKAEELIEEMLKHEILMPEKTLGNYLYLDGLIYAKTGRLDLAIERFEVSRDLYVSLELDKQVFNTELAIADLQIKQGRLELAEAGLGSAFRLAKASAGKTKIRFGNFYALRAKLAFQLGRYQDALAFSRLSHENYSMNENRNGMANSLSDMGFYLMLLGDYETGFNKSLMAEELIIEIEDKNKYYYNLLNFVLYNRCTGSGDSERMATMIRKRAERDSDSELAGLLEFVSGCECADPLAVRKIGDGDPDKPDNP